MIIKYGGILFFVCGVAILVFTLTFVRMVNHLDMSSLSRYAPNEGHTYEDLFELTKLIGGQRNYLAMLFFITLSSANIILGAVLFLWARDNKRLQKE